MSRSFKNWLLALVLTVPMILFYLANYLNHSASLIPTGFVGYDNVSYVANAKQYLDADRFSLLYSNPLNDSANYPTIYFQTQTIFLAFLLWLGFAPGFTIVLLNWLGTLFSFRMAIAIYDQLYPNDKRRRLFITFFCWGGGLLALTGLPVALARGNFDFLDSLFIIDPAWGWWGLNFGRGHFFSTEGYFHFLFLAGIFCILKRKWNLALLVSLVLSLSHPFTGVEYLCIVAVWSFAEKLMVKNKDLPWIFFAGTLLILAFHLSYYLYYLNQFPEHRSVNNQYALNWRLRFYSMIPAYCIVGLLAMGGLVATAKHFFRNSSTRLFFTWFVVTFLLANHELFMRPMQPLHFTRGYLWASLFLLGLPALHWLFNSEKLKRRRIVLLFFAALLFSDNFLWVLNGVAYKRTSTSVSHISYEQKSLLQLISKEADSHTLIIGNDDVLVYMSTVYSKAYPWISHPFTTPFAKQKEKAYRDFIEKGTINPAWKNRKLIFIFHKADAEERSRSQSLPFPSETLADTWSYLVLEAVSPD